jgi:hypothetical protein
MWCLPLPFQLGRRLISAMLTHASSAGAETRFKANNANHSKRILLRLRKTQWSLPKQRFCRWKDTIISFTAVLPNCRKGRCGYRCKYTTILLILPQQAQKDRVSTTQRTRDGRLGMARRHNVQVRPGSKSALRADLPRLSPECLLQSVLILSVLCLIVSLILCYCPTAGSDRLNDAVLTVFSMSCASLITLLVKRGHR